MFERQISNTLTQMAEKYPVVTLMGPRQSGKTTVIRHVFDKKPYLNLEAPDIRQLAKTDPRAFLAHYPDGCILDEIQNMPELLSYIQTIVDQRDEEGLYVLTGSHQLGVHHSVAQSLAGRTAMLCLLPLSFGELAESGIDDVLEKQLIYGGYPRIYNKQIAPKDYFRDYVQTYLEKDVRQLINVKDLVQFQRFMQLCAARVGQLIDMTNIANDLGVSRATVADWLSVLEASYVIYRLPPYFENFGKRMIKSSKLYFYDVALASYLLDLEEENLLLSHPMRGHLFENLLITELLKAHQNRGMPTRFYFYRDSHQNEVDLLIEKQGKLFAIEIKSSTTFHSDFLKGLDRFQKIAGLKVKKSILLYAGDREQKIQDIELLNYKQAVTTVIEDD